MEEILRALSSNNNEERNRAEKSFNDALAKDLRGIMNQLMQVVLAGQDENLCEHASVICRGQLTKSNGREWWANLAPGERQNLRSVILERLRSAGSMRLKKAVSELIVLLSEMSFDEESSEDEWPSLLEDLARISTFDGDDGSVAAVALLTVNQLASECTQKFTADSMLNFQNLLRNIMANPPKGNSLARLNASLAMASIIQVAELISFQARETVKVKSRPGATTDFVNKFAPGVLAIVDTLEHIVRDDRLLLKWLEAVIELTEFAPKIVAEVVPRLLGSMLQVANDENFSEDARKQSLEVCITAFREMPVVLKANEQLIRETVRCCIVLMLASEEDPDDIFEDRDDEGAQEASLLDAGGRGVLYICESIGEDRCIPIIFPMVTELLSASGDWRKESVGLLTLARTVYNGDKLFFENLGPILNQVLPYLANENTHICVRLRAFEVLSGILVAFLDYPRIEEDDEEEFDEENVETLAKVHGQKVLVALSTMLSEPTSQDPKQWLLKSKAAQCMIYFCHHFTKGEGEALLGGDTARELLGKLHRLIELSGQLQQHQLRQQHQSMPTSFEGLNVVSDTQQAALSAVGYYANAIGQGFSPFYDTFMPIAQNVYQVQDQVVAGTNANASKKVARWTEKQVQLRGTALEVIGSMGDAVGFEKFAQDAQRLLQMTGMYMDQFWDKGDTEHNFQVAELTVKICSCMESVDEQVFAKIIPRLIKWASKPTGEELTHDEVMARIEARQNNEETGDDEEDDEEESNEQYLQLDDGRFVAYNTSLMHEKRSVINFLEELCDRHGASLMPWAGDLARLLLTEVRATCVPPDTLYSAVNGVGNITHAVVQFVKKQGQQASTEQRNFAQQLFDESLDALVTTLADSLRSASEMDETLLDDVELGKESDEYDDEDAILITTLASKLEGILRDAFESGGRSDTDVDLLLAPGFTLEANPPLVQLADHQIDPMFCSIAEVMRNACERRRGYSWWKETHVHEVMDSLSSAIGLLIKTHGSKALPSFEKHVYPFAQLLLAAPLQPKDAPRGSVGVTAQLKANGVFFVDDAIEFGRPFTSALVPDVAPLLIECAKSTNHVLRQAAVYGLGVCAEHGGQQFQPFLNDTINSLIAVIEAPKSRKPPAAHCTENAISALLNCVIYRGQWAGLERLLSYDMPCTFDTFEARVIHYRMYKLLKEQNPNAAPFAARIKAILQAAAADKTGWNDKENRFDQDSAILSNETRAFVHANLQP